MADEQVGNNSYLTMTPGSAVAGQLQNILTQKRLEARQAMLDQIHAQDVTSQIKDRDENARSNAEIRAANAENRKAQEIQRRAGLYAPGTEMDPESEDYKYIQKEAPTLHTPATPETPQFDYEGQAPIPASKPTFRGLPVQIEAARKAKIQQDAQDAFNSPDFAKRSATERAAIYRLVTGSEPTADIIEGRKEPHSQIYTEYQDYLASKPSKPLSFNDYATMDANRKQVKPAVDHGNYIDRPVLDKDGNVDPTKAYFMRNGHMVVEPVPGGGSIGAKPNGQTAKPLITQGEAIKLATLRKLATDEPGSWGLGGKAAKEGDKAAYAQLEADIYGRFPPALVKLAKEMMETEDPSVSNEAIVMHALENEYIKPGEQQPLYHLLQNFRDK